MQEKFEETKPRVKRPTISLLSEVEPRVVQSEFWNNAILLQMDEQVKRQHRVWIQIISARWELLKILQGPP